MVYICPYCGNREQGSLYCSKCLRKIEWVQEISHKSSFYYNKGYEAALTRNLTLAIKYLNKALVLNKYHIEARNLLGLIYFEIGEVGAALKEWIISQSLKKEDNLASYYINQISKKQKILSNYKEAITLYNKALGYLKQKNVDMAIIRLKKAISIHPQLVEARVLLGLSYMYQKKFHKANEHIKRALAIDGGNEKGLLYFKEMEEEDTKSIAPYEIEYHTKAVKEVRTSRVMDRGRMFRRCLLYFLLGSVGMLLIERYLILPNEIKAYHMETSRLKESETVLTQKIQTLTTEYGIKVAELESSKNKLENEVISYENQLSEFVQKEKIADAKNLINEGNYVEAAQMLYNVASTQLDTVSKDQFKQLKEVAYPKAIQNLYHEGISLYNQDRLIEASTKFESILLYEPEESMASKSLYYIGCIYERNKDLENAKRYFEKIIADYSETQEARKASSKLEKITSNS